MAEEPLVCTPMRPAESNTTPTFELPDGACDAHMHVFESGYPRVDHPHYTFPDARLDQYTRVASHLGIDRWAIVQPSYYGTDNRVLLDTLTRTGDSRCRGVAQIDEDISDAELDRFHRIGVRAIRLDLFARSEWPTSDLRSYVTRMAARAADRGWHLQFYVPGRVARSLLGFLADLGHASVIDHMGYMKLSEGVDDRDLDRLIDALDSGTIWIKLSGAYRVAGDLPMDAVTDLGRALVAARPDRLCWGSDWPHLPDGQRDTGELVNLLSVWAPSPADRQTILVDSGDRLYFWD